MSRLEQRRLRHVLVDILDMIAGGLISAAVTQRSWKTGAVAGVVAIVALTADRWSALHD